MAYADIKMAPERQTVDTVQHHKAAQILRRAHGIFGVIGMRHKLRTFAVIIFLIGSAITPAIAGDLKISVPKRSQLTPVQRLNREGVDFIRKHQYEKAADLFYKAYLFDPGDPFTLYNLGYISELQGQLDRAQSFYKLASEQATDAVIDRASSPQLKGKPMKDAVIGLNDAALRINRDNIEAIRLLSQNRAVEADTLLQQTLSFDPRNAFTLNNLGVAKESEGESEEALKYYLAATNAGSSKPALVTSNRSWRGKPISDMAAASAKRLQERMRTEVSAEARANAMTERGVSAVNRNDWSAASQDFVEAYRLNPDSAFSLNNLGYLSEMQGDLETAEFFYERARQAQNANIPVGLASRRSAEGVNLSKVAADSDKQVASKIEQTAAVRRRLSGPVELIRRDNTPVIEPQQEPQQAPASPTETPTNSEPHN